MKFSEKIRKILETNKLGLSSIADLEKFCGFGANTVRLAMNTDRGISLKSTKKLINALKVDMEWWKTGQGEVFTEVPMAEEPYMGYGTEGHLRKMVAILEDSGRSKDALLVHWQNELAEAKKEISELKKEVASYKKELAECRSLSEIRK